MSRILITGGFGFVGGRLTRRLSQQHEVWASSRRSVDEDTLRLHGNVRRFDHSLLLNQDTFPSFIDTVIHLASLNEIDSVKYPSEAIRVNVDETRLILQHSIHRGVKRFIYFSTAHIYGSPLQGTITEETLPVPVHPYAITHRCAEDYIVASTIQKEIKGTVLRLSNAFGAPVSPHVNRWSLLTNDLCRQVVEKGKLILHSNGCQFRDFICLNDVEDIIENMIVREDTFPSILYNLGSGTSTRIIDMARDIATACVPVFHKDISIEFPEGALPSKEPALNFSVDRLLADGFRLRNDVRKELDSLLLFCIANFTRH